MDEKEKVTNEVKNEEKAKSKNAVVLLIVLGIALLVVVGLVVIQQLKMSKPEIGAQDKIELNVEKEDQNVQNNTVVNLEQEEVEDKEEPKEEIDNKQEENKEEQVTTESKEPEKEKEEPEQVKVDFDYIANKLFEAYGIKEEVDKLPQVTDEERPKYEKIWNDMVAEKNNELVQIIKEKYPTLSDKQAKEYATKVFEYAKEYGLRIAKQSEQVIEDAKDAIESADKADALSKLALKYTEVLTNYMQTNPGQSYKVNESDLKILQQHILEETDGKYTVKIKQDNSGYDVVKVAN